MLEPLKPQFFVTRQNGNMVPLLAMDELPATFKIQGVSRSLSPHDIAGMTGVGNFDARHRHHVVEKISPAHTYAEPSLAASIYDLTDIAAQRPLSTASHPAPPKAYGIEEQAPDSSSSTAPSTTTTTPTPATAPHLRIDRNAFPHSLPPWHDPTTLPVGSAPGLKEYCSYWLRRGECDYAQQGCLYKHEMPLDQATLLRLGLRDIPKWYRERHGLGSYLSTAIPTVSVAGASEGKKGLMEKNWRAKNELGAQSEVGRAEKVKVKSAPVAIDNKLDKAVAGPSHRSSNSIIRLPSNTLTGPASSFKLTGPLVHKATPVSRSNTKKPLSPPKPTRAPRTIPTTIDNNTAFEKPHHRQVRETLSALDADAALNRSYKPLTPEKGPHSSTSTTMRAQSPEDLELEFEMESPECGHDTETETEREVDIGVLPPRSSSATTTPTAGSSGSSRSEAAAMTATEMRASGNSTKLGNGQQRAAIPPSIVVEQAQRRIFRGRSRMGARGATRKRV